MFFWVGAIGCRLLLVLCLWCLPFLFVCVRVFSCASVNVGVLSVVGFVSVCLLSHVCLDDSLCAFLCVCAVSLLCVCVCVWCVWLCCGWLCVCVFVFVCAPLPFNNVFVSILYVYCCCGCV